MSPNALAGSRRIRPGMTNRSQEAPCLHILLQATVKAAPVARLRSRYSFCLVKHETAPKTSFKPTQPQPRWWSNHGVL